MAFSMQIFDFNRFLEPNPFNSGPPIPPHLLTLTMSESEPTIEFQSEAELPTPDLSSSPTSTAPSSPRSSRSALSLDDPEIRKIWEDTRFGPIVRHCTPPGFNTFTPAASPFREEEYTLLNTPPFLKDSLRSRQSFMPAGSLNPLAQPFVPCFAVPEGMHSDQVSPFYGDNILLSPLNLRDGPYGILDSSRYLSTVEETSMFPPLPYPVQFYSPPIAYEDTPRPLDPPYPPGLPLPAHPAASHEPAPPAYLSILIEALYPTHDHSAREALIQSVFKHIDRCNLFSLRELTSTLMVAAFGDEREFVLPCLSCAEKACPDHGDESIETKELVGRVTLAEEAFHQVVAGLSKFLRQSSGQSLVDMFLVQVINSMFARFISYFDPDKQDSLNTYYKSHEVSPCISYIRSAFSLCKTIAFLYQRSIVQRVDVNRCIVLLLQDLMSVEHLEALRLIIVGSGMKLWDPPLSMLSTFSVADEGAEGDAASPSNFSLPPINQQAKAKLCGDITMFCSKLDGYKIKRGQSGCISLRGQKWNLSGEDFRARIKEVTDIVQEWEKELIRLIDEREGPSQVDGL